MNESMVGALGSTVVYKREFYLLVFVDLGNTTRTDSSIHKDDAKEQSNTKFNKQKLISQCVFIACWTHPV